MGIKETLQAGKEAAAKAAKQGQQALETVAEKAKPVGDQVLAAATEAAEAIKKRGEEYLATPQGKKVAAGAAAGAVLGVPLPILGPISGALVGGAVGWWVGLKDSEVAAELEKRCRTLTPKERQEELATLQAMFDSGQLSQERYREGWRALTGKDAGS